MMDLMTHGAVTAKAMTLYGRRITKGQYSELLGKRTIAEITAFLKNHEGYGAALVDTDERLANRAQLEDRLRRMLFEEYLSFLKSPLKNDRIFLGLMIQRYETEQLLSFFRYFESGRANQFIFTIPEYLIKHSSVDFEKLCGAESYEQAYELLEGTRYQAVLKQYGYEKDKDFSQLENLLYTNYYSSIFKATLRFKGKIGQQLKAAAGAQIDIINLIHIIRLKRYYSTPPEQIRGHLLPFGYRLKASVLNSMINAAGVGQVMELIALSPYAADFESEHAYLEESLHEHLYKLNKKIIRFAPVSVLKVTAYLNLKEIEARNLISIIEGKRYSVDSGTIRQHLTGIN